MLICIEWIVFTKQWGGKSGSIYFLSVLVDVFLRFLSISLFISSYLSVYRNIYFHNYINTIDE